jgi:uncharacterized protein YndB with AHSA1/START domain
VDRSNSGHLPFTADVPNRGAAVQTVTPRPLTLAAACADLRPYLCVVDIDRDAPVVASDEIAIAAPVELVWAIQTDVARWPDWRPDVELAEAHAPLSVNSSFSRRMAGVDIVSVVGELDPPRRIVWSGAARGIVAVQVWTVLPRGGGALVRTEESWDGEPVTAAAPEAMQAQLERALRAWLEQLKRTAEATPPPRRS